MRFIYSLNCLPATLAASAASMSYINRSLNPPDVLAMPDPSASRFCSARSDDLLRLSPGNPIGACYHDGSFRLFGLDKLTTTGVIETLCDRRPPSLILRLDDSITMQLEKRIFEGPVSGLVPILKEFSRRSWISRLEYKALTWSCERLKQETCFESLEEIEDFFEAIETISVAPVFPRGQSLGELKLSVYYALLKAVERFLPMGDVTLYNRILRAIPASDYDHLYRAEDAIFRLESTANFGLKQRLQIFQCLLEITTGHYQAQNVFMMEEQLAGLMGRTRRGLIGTKNASRLTEQTEIVHRIWQMLADVDSLHEIVYQHLKEFLNHIENGVITASHYYASGSRDNVIKNHELHAALIHIRDTMETKRGDSA